MKTYRCPKCEVNATAMYGATARHAPCGTKMVLVPTTPAEMAVAEFRTVIATMSQNIYVGVVRPKDQILRPEEIYDTISNALELRFKNFYDAGLRDGHEMGKRDEYNRWADRTGIHL